MSWRPPPIITGDSRETTAANELNEVTELIQKKRVCLGLRN